ncbi:pilin assembly protein [Exilibacterium tricleocarpae]|uniref:Pilin assembly protein n=1 Tax=Exilibacterium tricleocarpae TaxID=2591008 RepID=A0A545U3Q0_9GAMM|nr:pilin assembly protein [Exilibacterium tricleocarpae]TQV84101.1 pilin assembly protein [Exilibacterium tricleocarpae]
MKVSELARLWEQTAAGQLTETVYTLRLPVEDAAKLEALSEMYPKRSREHLLTDLLSAALDDLEKSLPYIKGSRVIAEDELGDPMFEDIGPTPRFLTLAKKHLQRLQNQQSSGGQNGED